MDPEIKNLLEKNLNLSEENNKLLLKIRGVQKWARITKVIYWFIILGVSFGAFYFIQPYFEGILNIYSGGVSDIGSTKNIGGTLNVDNWRNLIKDIN